MPIKGALNMAVRRADTRSMTGPARIWSLAAIAWLALAAAPQPSAPASAEPEDSYAALEKRTVQAVQRLSMRSIDSTLANVRFDQWFRQAVGPDAWISWELNDCGEHSGSQADSARAIPMCVEALAEWGDGRKALVWIVIDDRADVRIGDAPELYLASAGRGDRMRDFYSLAQFARYARVPDERPRETPKK